MTFPAAEPVAIDGVRFAVRRARPSRKRATTPVLLLHGVPQTSTVWHRLLPELAQDRIVIAPDLKGLGGSEHRPPYDRPTLARELAALSLHVLDEMGAGGDGVRIDVVGHDFGGVLALALAAERPDLVRRLVVASAPYRKVDPLHLFHVPLLALPVLPALVLRRVSFARLAYKRAWRSAVPPDPARVDADAAAYAGADRVAGMLAYYRAAARAARTPAPDVAVERALVVWGSDDPALPIEVGEAVVKDLGRAGTDPVNVRMLVATGAGHFVIDEAADVVVPAIAAFLRDGDPKTSARKSTATKKQAAPRARVATVAAGKVPVMTETPLEADPADVAEQQREAVPRAIDLTDERPDEAVDDVPTDANRPVDVDDDEEQDEPPFDE